MTSSDHTMATSPAIRLGQASSYRWWICLMLFAATLLNYFDRQILSLLKPLLDEQFQWTNWQFGLINSAFQGAYAVALVGWGWLMDRRSLKITFAIAIGVWSLAAMGHALVAGVAGFIVVRVLLGLGEGGCFPGAIKAVGEWFPARERSLATRARKTGMLVFAILVVPISFVSFAGDWLAVRLTGLAGSAHQAWSANLFSTVSDIFPEKAVASVVGIGGMAGAIGGMLFPLACGLILDSLPSTGYAILFGACGLAYVAAFALNHLLSPSFALIQINKTHS